MIFKNNDDNWYIQLIDQQAKGNRSAYINALLAKQRRKILETEIIAADRKSVV